MNSSIMKFRRASTMAGGRDWSDVDTEVEDRFWGIAYELRVASRRRWAPDQARCPIKKGRPAASILVSFRRPPQLSKQLFGSNHSHSQQGTCLHLVIVYSTHNKSFVRDSNHIHDHIAPVNSQTHSEGERIHRKATGW